MYNTIAKILVIAGAINWGLVASKNIDVVKIVTGGGVLDLYIKLAVAVAGVYYAYMMYNNKPLEDFWNLPGHQQALQAQQQAQQQAMQAQQRAQQQVQQAQQQAVEMAKMAQQGAFRRRW